MINTVKNKFVKNRVGGREVNLNLDNVFKYTVVFFGDYPLDNIQCHVFFVKLTMNRSYSPGHLLLARLSQVEK